MVVYIHLPPNTTFIAYFIDIDFVHPIGINYIKFVMNRSKCIFDDTYSAEFPPFCLFVVTIESETLTIDVEAGGCRFIRQ